MICAQRLLPLRVRAENAQRVRVSNEAVAKRRRSRRIRRVLDGRGLLRPHQCGPRRATKRALLATLAALRLEREELAYLAVGELLDEVWLVRVEKGHAR